MAQKKQVIVTVIDDLTGEELADGEAVEILFGFNNVNYRMDLSQTNAGKLEKFLKPYIDAAERVSGGRGRPRSSSSKRPDTGSGLSKDQLQAIRDWANKNGYEVSPRGRIKQDIIDAFDAAHNSNA